MIVFAVWNRVARRVRIGLVTGALVIALATMLHPLSVRAQDAPDTADVFPPPPLMAPFGGVASVQSGAASRPRSPALDALTPQVGPLIKHYYADVVDRRTTAFLPTSLDDLTPIDMPQTDEHWARIDLSEQTLLAYSGDTPIRAFIVSSGLPGTPTVTGEFHIRAKVRSQLMEGGSRASDNYYNLPNVEWVQYFFDDYGLHGTYWHNDFGRPHSHGCVNMTNADAKWMWDFLDPVWDGESPWQRSTDENPGSLVIVTE